MRYISKYGRYAVQIRPMIQEAYANGSIRVIQESIYAKFEPYRLTPLEREIAVTHWTFNGFYQEQDEVTIVPPDYRIGLYDSDEAAGDEGWDEATHDLVDTTLMDLADRYDDIIAVRSQLPPPWPRYDEFGGTPQALVRKLVDEGHDLDSVLTYEREHQRRPKVISELEEAISSGVVEVVREEEVIG